VLDYAPRNWKYRWILLDGSLSTIYLVAFTAIAWLWRPTRDNVRFSMSQELAQDEADADAEDYEIDALENGMHRRLPTEEDEDGDGEGKGLVNGRHKVGEENVVFAMGEDSDEESEDGHGHASGVRRERTGDYRDDDGDGDTDDDDGVSGQGRKSPKEAKGTKDD
jgi:hypothetical protein